MRRCVKEISSEMTFAQKVKKMFLYANLEKEEYEKLLPTIREENRLLLIIYSKIAAAMFFLLFAASTVTGGFTTVNTTTYLASGVVVLLILYCAQGYLHVRTDLVTSFVYIFELLLYGFGVRISMLHADAPAVSAIAFLLVSPLLFYDRPVRLSAVTAGVVAVFCAMTACFKEPNVAATDIWNALTFGVVSGATTMFLMSVKIRALAQSKRIEYLSQTDLLTGVKNRNHYEDRLQTYPEMCKSSLVCVYGDVNGLHEMNNREGHRKGDEMLRVVAEAMQRSFGAEHTYRVGGDEFVAFLPDGQAEKAASEIKRIQTELEKQGYHVSFGVAVWERDSVDMNKLVSEAETSMFEAKQEFYRQPENNRRSR